MSFLPGMFPGGALMGVAVVPTTTLAFEASAVSTNSASITGPASIIAGDLLVLTDMMVAFGSAPASAVPSGFSSMQTATVAGAGGFARQVLSRKVADGSEASASLTGMSGAGAGSKILFVFRPDVPITTASDASGGAEGTSGDPSAQNVAASGGTPPLVVIGAYGELTSTAAISPRTFSPTKDGEVQQTGFGGDLDQWLAYKIYNSSPADVSIDMDDEGDGNSLLSRYIQVS